MLTAIPQPRYDPVRKIYRDCKWCGGKGCLSCEGEADKAYKREFPDGPKPILTLDREPGESDENLLGRAFAALSATNPEFDDFNPFSKCKKTSSSIP